MRNYRKSIICVFAIMICFFLFLSFKAIAANSDSRNSLILLGNEKLPPIVYDNNGTARGVAVDIAKALGKSIGYDVKVITAEWEQAQTRVLNGEGDGLLQINPSPERIELYDFSGPLLRSDFSIFVRNDNVAVNNIDDLKNKRVGVESGGYPSNLIQEFKEIDAVLIHDWKVSFQDLSAGVIDAIVVDRWIGEYQLAQSRIAGIIIIKEPVETQYSRIAVRKGDAETMALINAGIKAITEDGTVSKILEGWRGKKVVYITEDYFQNFYLRTAIIFLLLVALVAISFLNRYRKLSKRLETNVKERTEELHRTNEMLKEANLKLERISKVDSLTAIGNRRGFDFEYARVWKKSLLEGTPLALIMLDIDYFKVFNDTFGHLSGDQALIRIAESITNVVKDTDDFAARYGGEEFVVMLVNTCSEDAVVVAEEIRKRIEELGIQNGENNTVLTVSLGVSAVVPDNTMVPDELIETADKALYMAKEAGRNKVIVWEQD